MAPEVERGTANTADTTRLRFSVSLVKQGKHQFYTLTMPSDVLAETCVVTSRKEDPKTGFQRNLDEKRASAIADYIDHEDGTIPSSIVLSAQPAAQLKIVGRGKTIEFSRVPAAFLILDGQHRVFGFSKARTSLRVPVVIYNGLSRRDETRLFIDINTKQKPVPAQLLLDIKQLAETETDAEIQLRDIFDTFNESLDSAMAGFMSPAEAARNKITRVTFNLAVKPLLPLFAGRETDEIYEILNAFLSAAKVELNKKEATELIGKPVVFRAVMGIFRPIAQRVSDRHGQKYTEENFSAFIGLVFSGMQRKKLESSGTSWVALRDHLETRLNSKLTL